MLWNFNQFVRLTSQVLWKCEVQSLFQNAKYLSWQRCDFCLRNQRQNFHTSEPRTKRNVDEYRKAQKDAVKKTYAGSEVEGSLAFKSNEGFFPKGDLSNILFNGIAFKNLPIVNIKVSRNNTILGLYDEGVGKVVRSCGTEGFKNARKGTNVAAQTTGIALGLRAVKKGYKTVRVIIKGLGPGRVSSLKGLHLAGVNVVSITDVTRTYTKLRPRKQKRL